MSSLLVLSPSTRSSGSEGQQSTSGTESIWVRELMPEETSSLDEANTGETLPDGSVFLRREDMVRMGLEGLRAWILQKVIEEQVSITIGGMANGEKLRWEEDETF